MKTKKSLCFFVAVLVALYAISLVAAGQLDISIDDVVVDDVSASWDSNWGYFPLAASPGDTIPVKVKFISYEDTEDLKLKVWIDGYRSDVSAITPKFDVVNGSIYIKKLSIKLPPAKDMEDVDEELTLYVRISDKTDEVEQTYIIKLQKEPYEYDLLSVDAPLEASAGDIIALDVVLKNRGASELEDSFVTAVIPELGVQKKAYFGDIYPNDDTDEDNTQEDAKERRIYLSIPSNAPTGVYQIEVSASNYDASSTVKKSIAITGLAVSDDNNTSIDTGKTDNKGIPNSIIILTVVLVVIFVVLLVVLIILLTKKPSEKINDFGETSYY